MFTAVATGKEDLQIRPVSPQFLCQFEPAPVGKHNVREHEVQPAALFFKDRNCLIECRCNKDLISLPLKHQKGKLPDILLVLYKQNPLITAANLRGLWFVSLFLYTARSSWEINPEVCPVPRFAVYIDPSVVSLYYAVYYRETEPCTLTYPFCGEKRVKYMGTGFGIHACPCILHRDLHKSSGVTLSVNLSICLINACIFGLYQELSSIRHGVPGIHNQVHKKLLQLSRISLRVPEVWRKLRTERDILSDQALEHPGHLQNGFVYIEYL